MSATVGATLVAAAVCYGVASVLRVELSNGRRVTGVAAFGPALIALGPWAYEVAPLWALLASALLGQSVAMGVRRSGWWQFLVTFALLVVSAGTFGIVTRFTATDSLANGAPGFLLMATLAATAPYAMADLILRQRRSRSAGTFWSELRWEVPLYLVLGSTAGLVVLGFGPLGWVAFPLLLLVLLVTWHEFRRFAEARRTYEQTVRAMGRLAERAGYAPAGYHERVAALAAEVGQELGLGGEEVRALRLVGQVERVGAVSLPEPGDLRGVDPSYVEESGRRILEETGHLAPYADLLKPESSNSRMEAEVLKAVGRFVQAKGTVSDRLLHLREKGEVRGEVLEALARCAQEDASA